MNHSTTCPVSSPDWSCRYSNHDFDACTCRAFKRPEPALPYPVGINISVFRDDGEWDKYTKWFMRPMHEVVSLAVCKITLAHYEGDETPAYTHDEWCEKAESLVTEYPDCIFVYTGTTT